MGLCFVLLLLGNIFHAYQIFRYTSDLFDDNKLYWYKWIIIILFGCGLDLFKLTDINKSVYLYIYDVLVLNFIFSLMFRADKYFKIFIAGNIVLYFLAIRGVVLSLLSTLLKISIYDLITSSIYFDIWGLITVLLLIITFPIFRHIYSYSNFSNIRHKYMKLILLFQYISIVMISISSIPYYYNTEYLFINWYNLVNNIMVLYINYSILIYMNTLNDKFELKIKSDLFEKQINYSLANYKNKVDYIEKLIQFKKEYKNIIKLAKISLANDDISNLKNILKKSDDYFLNIENYYKNFSNDKLLQAMMSHFSNKCIQNEILFKCNLSIDKGLELNDYEKCRIFDNLINNAIEACDYLDKEYYKRYIKINTINNGNWYSFVIENSFDGFLKKNNGVIVSRKKHYYNHGFGLKNVIEIIEKKNGFIDIKYEKNYFRVIINLPIY